MMLGGYVLAGGQSSRMGTDKAHLILGTRTLLEHTSEAVREAVGSVVVVGHPERHASPGVPVIQDWFPGAGPLAGIHAALLHSPSDWNLVVACDMPRLTAHVLRTIVDVAKQADRSDVILPQTGGRLQPLCAVYHQRAIPACTTALAAGRFKILLALEPLRVKVVEIVDPDLFRNVNTPEDWERASAEAHTK